MTRLLEVRCPGSERWIDPDARDVAAMAAVVTGREVRIRCPECEARVRIDLDGYTVVHKVEVEMKS